MSTSSIRSDILDGPRQGVWRDRPASAQPLNLGQGLIQAAFATLDRPDADGGSHANNAPTLAPL
jgi:hypothetical protein